MPYFEDDFFSNEQDNNNYDDFDDYTSTTDTPSVNSHGSKKKKNSLQDVKKVDTGFHKIKRVINKKLVKIAVYETNNTPGSRIRDAITGARLNYRVGSNDENLFFKVRMATGETGQNPPLLFYDSPGDFERHQYCELPVTLKETWNNKMSEERSSRMYSDTL